MPGENHGWIRLDRYLEIHQTCMDDIADYFVVGHNVQQMPALVSSNQVRFSGVISCYAGIEIHVDQILERDDRNRVRALFFRYHAQLRVPAATSPPTPRIIYILRYDNAHHFREHPDAFHKHLFTLHGEPASVQHVGREHFPTLRNVIDEVFEWWQQHRDNLPFNH